ncbi:hypothetical protein LXL04_025316 [Taraxacum kok-saghyz]
MSTTSSSSSFPNQVVANTPCGCGLTPRIRTSRTAANPGRRFLVCPVGKCGFWEWEEKLEIEAMQTEIRSLRHDLQDVKQKQFTLMAVLFNLNGINFNELCNS